jgi:hypothetical protein
MFLLRHIFLLDCVRFSKTHSDMARKGRPATRALDLRDGFYLELKNSASSKGIKIRRDTLKEMEDAIEEYSKTKIVIVLGEYKEGKALSAEKTKKSKK